MKHKIIQGDCIEVMKTLPDNSVDAIVTDPPYGLGFMGKEWDIMDSSQFGIAGEEGENDLKVKKNFKMLPRIAEGKALQDFTFKWATEALRVLKAGGYLLSFGGTRTYHRMATAIEDAGFEIRDMIEWVYSTGFPKSLNVQKQINKKYLNECGFIDVYEQNGNMGRCEKIRKYYLRPLSETDISEKKSDTKTKKKVLQSELQEQSISFKEKQFPNNDGKQKPCVERWDYIKTSERELQRCKICEMSKRVFIDGEERWLCNGTPFSYGTSDWETSEKRGGCSSYRPQSIKQSQGQSNVISKQYCTQKIRSYEQEYSEIGTALKPSHEPIVMARKPLSEKTVAKNILKWGTGGINIESCRIGNEVRVNKGMSSKQPECAGTFRDDNWKPKEVENIAQGRFPANLIHDGSEEVISLFPNNNQRFFYCAKASKSERNYGCDGLEAKYQDESREIGSAGGTNPRNRGAEKPIKNHHPTVKPIALMEYLIKLVTPEGGIVLEPFAGSGTTCVACVKLGYDFIGIEKEEEYIKIIKARIKPYLEQTKLKEVLE